jgi:signal transduction histidine kinase/DNA-binding response OmpR family regulator
MSVIAIIAGAFALSAGGSAVTYGWLRRRHGRRIAELERAIAALGQDDPSRAMPVALAVLGPALGAVRAELLSVHEGPVHIARPWHPERGRWLAELAAGRALAVRARSVSAEERLHLEGTGCLLLAPIAIDGRLAYALAVHRRGCADAADADLAALRLVASAVGAATQQQAAEEALAGARADAESGRRAKDEFLANISHELRTPLNGILGLAGLLADDDLPPRQREYAQVIRTSAENLHTLLNDLIEMSANQGDRAVAWNRLDPLRLAEEVAVMLADRAASKGIELVVEPAPHLPLRIVTDPSRLRQAMVNVIGNAVKFTATGHVRVVVGWHEGASARRGPHEPTDELVVEVIDTGIGIDASQHAAIFAPFSQGDGSTTRRHGGTGIGLTIAQRNLEALGGRLTCTSEPGGGSTFALRIPAHEASSAGSARSNGLRSRLLGVRLLVVDPSPVARAALVAQGLRLGMAVEGVADAATALARLTGGGIEAPQMVAVCAAMPGSTDLPGQARAVGFSGAWVLISPASRRALRSELQALGFAAGLSKPVRGARLSEAVQAALSGDGDDSVDATGPIARRAPLRVLVVEDDRINQRLIKASLEREGLRVDIAGDGAEGLEALHRADYDAVLLDLMMPVMDGFACARQIRQRERAEARPAIPLIAVTACTDEDIPARCLEAGMDATVRKPFEPKQLRRVIRRLVAERRRAAG